MLYSCRVQGLPFYYGFLTPVVLVIALNSVAFVLIIHSLMNAGSKIAANKRATGLQHVRRGTAILIVLGLTWIFGVFVLSDAKLFLQYLFAILNSFQGFLVFVFYCLLSSDTRAKYAKLCQTQRGSENSRKRYTPQTTSEGRFHEINMNKKKKGNVYTSSNPTSTTLPEQEKLEMTSFKA